MDVQTELYLEELSDRVEEADVECQTDAFLDRPPSPLFIPAKTGKDTDTQTEEEYVSIYTFPLRVFLSCLLNLHSHSQLLFLEILGIRMFYFPSNLLSVELDRPTGLFSRCPLGHCFVIAQQLSYRIFLQVPSFVSGSEQHSSFCN